MRFWIGPMVALLLSACGNGGVEVSAPFDADGNPVGTGGLGGALFAVTVNTPKVICCDDASVVPLSIGTLDVTFDDGPDATYEFQSNDGVLVVLPPTATFSGPTSIELFVTDCNFDVASATLTLSQGQLVEVRDILVYNACGPAGVKFKEIFDTIGLSTPGLEAQIQLFIRAAYLEEVKSPDGATSLVPPGEGEITAMYSNQIRLALSQPLFLPALFPAGPDQAAFGRLPPGDLDYNVYMMTLDKAVPLDNDTDSFAYFFGLQGTDDALDDFPEPDGQPCDPFIGLDRALRLGKEPGENWRLDVFGTDPQFGPGFFPFLTDASCIIRCNTIAMFIPTRETPRPKPLFRAITQLGQLGQQYFDAEPRARKPLLETGTPDQSVDDDEDF